MTIRELTTQDLTLISAGNADSGYEGNGGRMDREGRYGGAPNTCANQVGMNAIIGAFTGMPGGPWAMFGLSVAAGLSTAVTCANQKSNRGDNRGNNGALAGNSNPNSVNGQCRW